MGLPALQKRSFVDDMLWIARGASGTEAIAVALLFLSALGFPFTCGMSVDWVGYYNLDIEKLLIGIVAKRTRWIVKWLQTALEEDRVCTSEFALSSGSFQLHLCSSGMLEAFPKTLVLLERGSRTLQEQQAVEDCPMFGRQSYVMR